MRLVVIGLSHHTSPVELRERFAFAEAKIPEALQKLRANGVADEAVILSTCNRVEIYAAMTQGDRPPFQALQSFLVDCCDYRGPLNDEVCDIDGSPIVQRPDDNEATVRARMSEQLPPLLDVVDYYRMRGILQTVDGREPIADVSARMLRALGVAPGQVSV